MKFILRPYQTEAVDKSVAFLRSRYQRNGLVILPTGSGKSLCISEIVARLDGPALVFQPSKEILQQNYSKLIHYGFRPAIYSASLGKKQISGAVTLATIGSVIRNVKEFLDVKYILVDECDQVNPKAGMYAEFFAAFGERDYRILGLTATPYRLTSTSDGPILKFLTRTRPRVFDEVVYYVQNRRLFEEGHLAPLEYHRVDGFDKNRLQANSSGADYTDESVQRYFQITGFMHRLQRVCTRTLEIGRRGVLVFTRFVHEAENIVRTVPGFGIVSADTPTAERDRIIREFRSGRLRGVANVGILTAGFDYPELDTVVLARPTMSLRLYYQQVGRIVRPHPSKSKGMVIDMVGLSDDFGRVEDLHVEQYPLWHIRSGNKQLTNVIFGQRR